MKMNNIPIIKNLKKYILKQPISFHTPGHKGGQIIPDELAEIWPAEIWKYDVTEIFKLDNLHLPEGCIKEAQQITAGVFGAKSTYFLVNGSSVGLQAALLGICQNKQIFVPRHAHKSIYNGVILADAEPIYLPISYNEELGIPLGVEPQILEGYIAKYLECKAIILPNPTYQGISYKIKENIALAKEKGLQIIIDEAHGSHFCFHQSLPPSGLSMGADIVIQSWHKTLPALTQASVLHLGKGYIGPDISVFINMLQTTSPSYLLLASLDACRSLMQKQGFVLLEDTINKIINLKKEVLTLKTLKINYNVKEPMDTLKLCISSNKINGYQLAEILREKYQIYVELAEENYCLLIVGISASKELILKLKKALFEIDYLCYHFPERKYNRILSYSRIPERIMSPKKAFFAEKEVVAFNEAAGRVSADYIIKYPPGIPLVVPGEMMDKKILELLQREGSGFTDKKCFIAVKE